MQTEATLRNLEFIKAKDSKADDKLQRLFENLLISCF